MAVLTVIVVFTAHGVLTYQGVTSPWSPKMTAWSGDPVPKHLLKDARRGNCKGRSCCKTRTAATATLWTELGGQRGPDLTQVGRRMTRDQLIDQVSNGTPGGGNMPAYGKQMTPAEMTALVDFLVSLRPAGQPPAQPPLVSTVP